MGSILFFSAPLALRALFSGDPVAARELGGVRGSSRQAKAVRGTEVEAAAAEAVEVVERRLRLILVSKQCGTLRGS